MHQEADPQARVRQRSAVLSDDAWAELRARAVLEERSAAKLCEFLLGHYLGLEDKPIHRPPSNPGQRRTRSIYIADRTWAAAKALAVRQRRTVSDILEQLIRAYLGLAPGEELPSR